MQAVRAIGNWQPALSHLRTADKTRRDTIIQTLEGVFDTGAVVVLDQWFREAKESSGRVAALKALAKVHRKAAPYTGGWWGGKAAGGERTRLQETPWEATSIVLEAIEAGLQQDLPQIRLAALEVLREVPAPETLPEVRHMVVNDSDQDVRLYAIRLLADFDDTQVLPSLLRLATDGGTSNPVRQAAIRAVVAIDAQPYGNQLAEIAQAEDSPVALIATALDALATLSSDEARQAIVKRLNDSRAPLRAKAVEAYALVPGNDAAELIIPMLQDSDVSVQRATLSALAVMIGGADSQVRFDVIKALADAPDQRALPIYLDALLDEHKETSDASRSTLVALGNAIRDDIRTLHDRNELATPIRRELARVFASNDQFAFLLDESAAKLEPADYARYATKHSGDAHRGRQVFADSRGIGCAKCHLVGGAGAVNLGPNLLGIGAKYPRRELVRSVLEPSNRILIDFETLVVITNSGEIHQGWLRSQTPEQIELVTPEGKIIPIRADEIEVKKTSNVSPMPNGLASGMTLENFADIIAYLESLKQPFPEKAD
jgi:putative heme-binding domain-containing protein